MAKKINFDADVGNGYFKLRPGNNSKAKSGFMQRPGQLLCLESYHTHIQVEFSR